MWHLNPNYMPGSVTRLSSGMPPISTHVAISANENKYLPDSYLFTSASSFAIEKKTYAALDITRNDKPVNVDINFQSLSDDDFNIVDTEEDIIYDYEEEYVDLPRFRAWNEIKPLPKEGEIPIDNFKQKRKPKQQDIKLKPLVTDIDLNMPKKEKKIKNKKVKKNNGLKLIEELQKQSRKSTNNSEAQSIPSILYNDQNSDQAPQKPKVEKHVVFVLPSTTKVENKPNSPQHRHITSIIDDNVSNEQSKNGNDQKQNKKNKPSHKPESQSVDANTKCPFTIEQNDKDNSSDDSKSSSHASKSIERHLNINTEGDDELPKINPKVLFSQTPEPKKVEEPLSISSLDSQSGMSLLSAATLNISEELINQQRHSVSKPAPKVTPTKPIVQKKPEAKKPEPEEIKVQRAVPSHSQHGNLQVTLNQKAIQMAKEKMIMKAKEQEKVSQKLTSKTGLSIQLHSAKINYSASQSDSSSTEPPNTNSNTNQNQQQNQNSTNNNQNQNLNLNINNNNSSQINIQNTNSNINPNPTVEKGKTKQLSTKQIKKQSRVISLGPGGPKVTQLSEPIVPSEKIEPQSPVENIKPKPKPIIEETDEELKQRLKMEAILKEEQKLREEYEREMLKEIPKPIEYPTLPLPKVDISEFFPISQKVILKSHSRLSANTFDSLLENYLLDENENENENDEEDLIDAYVSGHYSLTPSNIPGISPESTSFMDHYIYASKTSYDRAEDMHTFGYLYNGEQYVERKQPVAIYIELPEKLPSLENKPMMPQWRFDPVKPFWPSHPKEFVREEMRPNVTGFVVQRLKPKKTNECEEKGVERRRICDRFKFCDRYFLTSILMFLFLGVLSVVLHLFDKAYF